MSGKGASRASSQNLCIGWARDTAEHHLAVQTSLLVSLLFTDRAAGLIFPLYMFAMFKRVARQGTDLKPSSTYCLQIQKLFRPQTLRDLLLHRDH